MIRLGGSAALLASAVLLAASACSGGGPAVDNHSAPPAPSRAALVARAALDPCPASVSGTVSNGLPDVTLPCLGTGPRVHLAGLRGTPVVLNIWGSWCTPCQAETHYLAAVYDALKPRVLFLGVDTEDDPDSALDFAPHVSPPMRYPSVVDDQKKVLIGLGLLSAVPSTVFVDAAGHVVHKSPGAYTSTAQLRADIARYLGVTG